MVSPTGAALDAYRVAETQVVEYAYPALLLPALAAGIIFANRNRLRESIIRAARSGQSRPLCPPALGFGVACIFLFYVGAEVSIGSLIVNYMKQAHVLGLDEQSAGKMIPFYWVGFGRPFRGLRDPAHDRSGKGSCVQRGRGDRAHSGDREHHGRIGGCDLACDRTDELIMFDDLQPRERRAG
jgi:hypothetical protein